MEDLTEVAKCGVDGDDYGSVVLGHGRDGRRVVSVG